MFHINIQNMLFQACKAKKGKKKHVSSFSVEKLENYICLDINYSKHVKDNQFLFILGF